MKATKTLCGCGNAKDEHVIVCYACWRQVPNAIKREFSNPHDQPRSFIARKQIERFATLRNRVTNASRILR